MPGALSIMLRPQSLVPDIKAARAAGITTIISLQETAEAVHCGLQDEAATCMSNGIAFLNHPIRDMQLPEPAPFLAFAKATATRISKGEHIALHCYASIGRSGMVTCAILGHFGYAPEKALTHVSTMRKATIPDTAEQRTFIHQIMDEQTR